jgi:FAD/FMN-containing dehydrogenase
MATIQDFTGIQYIRSAKGTIEGQAYQNNNYQYASSSHQIDHDMNPALIVQPTCDADIIAAIKYAKANKIAIAVKSGGHQYSGASSTSGSNILLDMKPTFKDLNNDLKVLDQTTDKSFLYVSVSWSLGELNGFLARNNLFLPHGQCADVHVGGHAQTGG